MRLATLRTAEGSAACRLEGEQAVILPYPDLGALLSSGEGWRAAAAIDGPRQELDPARLMPVVPRPDKILCLGLNYASHIREMGREAPSHPTLFAKFRGALIGARDDIVLPRVAKEMDWEVELALVISRPARHVEGAEAEAAIAGYTVFNDVSARDWQYRTTQFLQGKTFEHTTPVGPVMVTADEVDGARDLRLTCSVDGELMQEGRTSDLLFPPAEVVAYVSRIITLLPGDLVATGTPAGVGHGRTPQRFLQPGEVVTTAIEGIGELVNRCVEEAARP